MNPFSQGSHAESWRALNKVVWGLISPDQTKFRFITPSDPFPSVFCPPPFPSDTHPLCGFSHSLHSHRIIFLRPHRPYHLPTATRRLPDRWPRNGFKSEGGTCLVGWSSALEYKIVDDSGERRQSSVPSADRWRRSGCPVSVDRAVRSGPPSFYVRERLAQPRLTCIVLCHLSTAPDIPTTTPFLWNSA